MFSAYRGLWPVPCNIILVGPLGRLQRQQAQNQGNSGLVAIAIYKKTNGTAFAEWTDINDSP